MKELSLHILDIAQNSVNAQASFIEITIDEQEQANELIIELRDNGCGMDAEMLKNVNNPFFTTAKKKTGLGIPLLKQHAEATGGEVKIGSVEGSGTWIQARFIFDHIDRQPMGDITSTILNLIRSYPDIEWKYSHKIEENIFELDTRDIKSELGDLAINHPQVIKFIREMIRENLEELMNN